MEWAYFEGGEPMLFYPLLLEGIRIARQKGFKVGVVTNAYFATNEDNLDLWLNPLAELGVSDLSVSDDAFHHEEGDDNPARRLMRAAKRLGVPVSSICIDAPTLDEKAALERDKGAPIVGGSVLFKGRAVEKLTDGLPRRPWTEFTECPHEDLVKPERVHIDSYGNAQPCQGITLGNIWKTPLSEIDKTYDPATHPICGPLVKGGPALLATENAINPEKSYVDACHFCYMTRKALLGRYPQHLAPKQVYGIQQD
ncbi:MAG: hypothetical protein ABIK83_00040 [Candidatus Zixiibacteriota bacterium]